MTRKIHRRDFMKLSAVAGAAGFLTPVLSRTARGFSFLPEEKNLLAHDKDARALLAQMTLDEKIGQMTQADQEALKDVEDIEKFFLGSLLSGGNSDPKAGNSLEAWSEMYDGYQRHALKTRLSIPILYGVDAVHGHNNVLGAVIFPHNIGLGCTRNPKLIESAARVTAEEVRATGTQWAFSPCVTVPRDERWGRTYEGYGETPELAKMMGEAAVRGLQGNDLSAPLSALACAKHFVGDGGTAMGTSSFGNPRTNKRYLDQGDTRLTEEELRRIHMQGYITTIKAGVGTIMPSYNSWNGVKCSGSKRLLTEILKDELGFDGFLISDYNAIDQVDHDYKKAIEISINAGMDMGMVPTRYRQFIQFLKELVNENRVPMSRIDDAVVRILRVKIAMGMMDKSRSQLTDKSAQAKFGSAEHRAVGRDCVRQSMVLLKNEKKTLPIRKSISKLHVAGKSADDIGNQCGGWTIAWQGKSGDVTTGGTTVLQAIKNTVSPSTTVSYSRDGSGAAGADLCVVVIGETPYAEGMGDRDDLSLSAEDVATVNNAKSAGVPVAVILFSGRPMILNDTLDKSDAFIAGWLPGTEGQGVADVLFGDYKPTGKLSCSWPRSMAQIPINVGDKDYDPLFKYGFGLTY